MLNGSHVTAAHPQAPSQTAHQYFCSCLPASLLAISSSLSNNRPADWCSLTNPLPPFPVGRRWLVLLASQQQQECCSSILEHFNAADACRWAEPQNPAHSHSLACFLHPGDSQPLIHCHRLVLSWQMWRWSLWLQKLLARYKTTGDPSGGWGQCILWDLLPPSHCASPPPAGPSDVSVWRGLVVSFLPPLGGASGQLLGMLCTRLWKHWVLQQWKTRVLLVSQLPWFPSPLFLISSVGRLSSAHRD